MGVPNSFPFLLFVQRTARLIFVCILCGVCACVSCSKAYRKHGFKRTLVEESTDAGLKTNYVVKWPAHTIHGAKGTAPCGATAGSPAIVYAPSATTVVTVPASAVVQMTAPTSPGGKFCTGCGTQTAAGAFCTGCGNTI